MKPEDPKAVTKRFRSVVTRALAKRGNPSFWEGVTTLGEHDVPGLPSLCTQTEYAEDLGGPPDE